MRAGGLGDGCGLLLEGQRVLLVPGGRLATTPGTARCRGLGDARGVVGVWPRGRCRRSPVGAVSVIVSGVGRGFGGDVGVVAVPAAGHRDVQVLAVQARPDQNDPDVRGRALGAVDGGGPAVLAVLLEVVGGQDHAAATGEVLHDQPVVRPGSKDAVPVAVADMPIARAGRGQR